MTVRRWCCSKSSGTFRARLLEKHLAVAASACPSLKQKHITFHCLRHTTAMDLLHAGVEQTVIALWLGHESIETTQIYLDADLELKEKILARTIPFDIKPGKYRPDDKLLTFLNQLYEIRLCRCHSAQLPNAVMMLTSIDVRLSVGI